MFLTTERRAIIWQKVRRTRRECGQFLKLSVTIFLVIASARKEALNQLEFAFDQDLGGAQLIDFVGAAAQ
jgi:hypothetical protein